MVCNTVAPLTETEKNIVAANLGLARRVAWRFRHVGMTLGLELGELEAEAAFGLMRAVQLFNPQLGYRLSTFATWSCIRRVQRALQIASRAKRLPVARMGGDGVDPVDLAADVLAVDPAEAAASGVAEMLDALRTLPAREQAIVRRRWGLDGGEETLAEVAAGLGLTRQRVQQLEQRGLRQLHAACGRKGLRRSEVSA